MTNVVKIDIHSGHEEIENLVYNLKIIANLSKKKCAFFQTCTVNYESIAYCLTKFG